MTKLAPTFEYMPKAVQYSIANGIVPVSGGFIMTPFEYICGGRSMTKFIRDLYKMPDKVQAVFDVAMVDIIENAKQLLVNKPLGIWTGGWRSASEFLTPKLWQRFEWPYLKKIAELALEAGVTPIFHLDSNWERDLEFFKEMPKGKCLMFPDGSTNIFKIKEVLGDHMCINGDVPASLLAVGTEDEVYNYSRRLIKEIGPTGFILGQGCDIPMNAKLKNVKAMISAATGK
jgi:uroporphyrinogen-III decarboxylase